uniref:Uncharacterized protein n=1 Tax=Timema bartmani TaxID=61472 RepID=A0A7R9HXK0_9NEOP|nr:unnamed protein product [Timema bartmani]
MCSLEAVILLLALVPLSTASFATTTNNEDDVDFLYPGEARSERGLPECSEHGICSTLHRRFWLPLLVERLCRCPSRTECPWRWNNTDHHTMSLDNRSQLKFCENVSSLLPCTPNQAAMVKLKTTDNNPTDYINSTMYTSYTVACYCPPRHYWKQFNKTSIIEEMFINAVLRKHTCRPLFHILPVLMPFRPHVPHQGSDQVPSKGAAVPRIGIQGYLHS